jgi:hypothetical protein
LITATTIATIPGEPKTSSSIDAISVTSPKELDTPTQTPGLKPVAKSTFVAQQARPIFATAVLAIAALAGFGFFRLRRRSGH